MTPEELHRLVPHFKCGHPKTIQNSVVYGSGKDGRRLTRCRYCKLAHAEVWRRKNGIPKRALKPKIR